MITTLEYIEHRWKWPRRKGIRKEIKVFFAIFVIIFLGSNIVVNAQLYQSAFLDLVEQWNSPKSTISNSAIANESEGVNSAIIKELESHTDKKTKDKQIKEIVKTIENYATTTHDFVGMQALNSELSQWLNSYDLDFNTLPPSDRVIIPKLNINAPLVQSSFTKHIEQITTEDLDKDLFNGIVQYPTTPFVGDAGNTLIFWHTSYESWKNNPYGTIFRQMPKLTNGDSLQIVHKGKLYEYTVVAKTITSPSKVNEEYLKYQNGDYLTLLGCYPIWSDKSRILVVGKLTSVK